MKRKTQIIEPEIFTDKFGSDFWEKSHQERFELVMRACVRSVDDYGEAARTKRPDEFQHEHIKA